MVCFRHMDQDKKTELINFLKKHRWLILSAVFLLLIGAIYWLNPSKQLLKRRNVQRRSDLLLIITAYGEYAKDNNLALENLPKEQVEICQSGKNCQGLLDLSGVADGKKYLKTLPIDPKNNSQNGTGYFLGQGVDGRIKASAPLAEGGASISLTK